MFLELESVLEIHADQIKAFGGEPGVGDFGLLQSAIDAPINRYLYDDEADIFSLAASYCSHISLNHPFIDGNKRAALASALVFLQINGLDVRDRNREDGSLVFTDEDFAMMVENNIAVESSETKVAEFLFLAYHRQIFAPCIARAVHDVNLISIESSESLASRPQGEVHAYQVDAFASFVVREYIECCERHGIDVQRINSTHNAAFAAMVEHLEPEYQAAFGMVISRLP